MKAWVNGSLREDRDGVISALDHGFTVGDGVFETLKVTRGTAFALTRHIRRLQRSAVGLGLPAPERDVVATAVTETIAANAAELGDLGRLRITCTSGPGVLGSDRGPGPATLAVVTEAARPWPDTTAVALAPWPRNERSPIVGLKTTSYGENAMMLAWAKQRGCSEAVLANLAGELCEGTGSNVFVVTGGRLLTPPLGSGCLAGITRELVLKWCGAQEQSLPVSVLNTADEVFITSSTRDIHPVVQVDDRRLGVGAVTAAALAELDAQSRMNVDP